MTAVSAPWPPRTYVEQSFAVSINPEVGKILTVDTCPAGSRTRRRASRRQAVQRAAGSSGSNSSSAGSTSALDTDCVVRSTWVYCQAEMSIQSINQSITKVLGTRITEEQHTHFSVSCGCGMFEYPPSSNLCTWSKFAMRCAAVPGGSSTSTCANQHRRAFLSIKHEIMETRSPFCFTFSKGTTRSDNKLGTPLRCAVCCCCCCCCGGCGGCCCNTEGGRCVSSLTPGGN
jgi:hypothetical protein